MAVIGQMRPFPGVLPRWGFLMDGANFLIEKQLSIKRVALFWNEAGFAYHAA
jgi:hypothetical protein